MHDALDILQGLRPFEAALFASLQLPDEVYAQLERANDGLGEHGLGRENVERCVWRIVCDRRPVAHLSITNRGTDKKTLCFCCRADHRIFMACDNGYAAKLTPGTVWTSLQPYGRGNPETLERKFLAWSEEESHFDAPAIEVTDCVHLTCGDEEITFIDEIKTASNREDALFVFADWLEERGDARAECIRRFAIERPRSR